MPDALEWMNNNAGVMDLLFSLVVAFATTFYAVLTWKLVGETTRMR
jgi:hypothetical protein